LGYRDAKEDDLMNVCKHGGLKTKCEICERDTEIAELKQVVRELDSEAWDRIWDKHSNHWCPLAPKQEQYIQLIVNTELRKINTD